VMANKLIVQSFWLITGSLAVVFHNKFIDEKLAGGVNARSYLKFQLAVAIGSLPIVFGLYFFGKKLVSIFLGPQWEMTALFASLLAPLALTKLLIGPALSYYMSHEKVLFLSIFRGIQLLIVTFYFLNIEKIEVIDFLTKYVWLDFSFDLFLIAFSYISIKFD
jgi:O-antigen/teichoic acid export membrane protein